MAVTTIPLPTGQDLIDRKNSAQEVVRFVTVESADTTRLLLAIGRRKFKVTNFGANPVFVGVNGQSLDGVSPAGLPAANTIRVQAPSNEDENSEEFITASRVTQIFLQSTGGVSSVQVIASNHQ